MILLDAALPSIIIEFPVMLLALIPIIVIEGFALMHLIRSKKNVFKGIIWANIVSTVAGVPLSWGIRLALGLGIGLVTSEDNVFFNSVIFGYWPDGLFTHILIVSIIFCTTYLVSVFIEYKMLKFFRKEVPADQLLKFTFIVNAYSYGLLVLLVVFRMIIS